MGQWRLLAVMSGMLPAMGHAHGIPLWIAAAMVSPILVLLLGIVYGLLVRRLRSFAFHCGLTLLWVVLFWLASSYVTNDYLIWTPLALYIVHTIILIGLIVRAVYRRLTA